MRFLALRLCASVALAGTLVGTAAAAEICFKPRCQPAGPVVRLGDVADIVDTDDATRQRLAAVELLPTPALGTRRSLRAGEVADLLRLRGVALAQCRLSGASQIVIGGAVARPGPKTPLSPNRFTVRRATTRVQDAIVRHLQATAPYQEPWQVDVTLEPSKIGQLAEGRWALRVEGGAAPWVGKQVFAVATAANGASPIRVVADVHLPPAVVVAVRSLPVGVRVGANDVELARVTAPPVGRGAAAKVVRSLDQVVGRETTQAITAGQVFHQALLRRPILVRRSDVVTVYARTPGIRVRTNARAREDGSQGDLIMIESLADRQRYFARVTGPREVDVYAGGGQVDR